MDFLTFIHKLKARLTQSLPGEQAQFRMAPLRRILDRDQYEKEKLNSRKSAVLILFYPANNSIYIPLMLRPSEQGVHSGQVSFPGGRFEESDHSLMTTALREAEEEVGINRSKVEMIGALTSVYIPVSKSHVHPFIGFIAQRPQFQKNKKEVKEIIETDISIISDKSIKGNATFPSPIRTQIEAPYYLIREYKVWGATAMILSELEQVIKEIEL